MRAAMRPGKDYRGRHQYEVLARFCPTWRQGLARGLGVGALGTATLALAAATAAAAAPGVIHSLAGQSSGADTLPGRAWLIVLAPLPLGALGGLLIRHGTGLRVDELGVRGLPLGRGRSAPWCLTTDIRAERRGRRTVVALYLEDGTPVRLPAPYDGPLLARDAGFERKLFLIRHLWETHRDHRAPA